MKALPYNNLNIPYISLLYVYQELKYNKGMKTMKNNENKKIFLKYLEIKNQILIEMPKWRTQGFILNCDVEVLISLIDQLAGGSRFFSEETAIRVEDACMEIEEIINCLGS